MAVSIEEIKRVKNNADLIVPEGDIEIALEKMAVEITNVIGDKDPIVLCVMIGGMVPAGKLLTKMDFPFTVDYVHATRYLGNITGADIEWVVKPTSDLKDRVVLIIDDILDEGHTLARITEYCEKDCGAADVKTAVLVDKQHDRRFMDMQADFVGVTVEDRYVFGEGMDYKGYLRNLSGIYALSDED
ncbi:MAG: hypoxanthine-guanine phosphoribosyltransferase [Gammaproteobacteria bacterium]|nr:MAG: hypoxanthine-guanine phosphoribosyltransferase [Gammaproteobacteria bacterium]